MFLFLHLKNSFLKLIHQKDTYSGINPSTCYLANKKDINYFLYSQKII